MTQIKWNRQIVMIKGTFYVSLPPPWAEANSLGKRAEINMELEPDGSLRLTKGGAK